MSKKLLMFIIILGGLSLNVSVAFASDRESTYLDAQTVDRGFTVEANDGNFSLGIRGNVLDSDATVHVRTMSTDEAPALPAGKEFVSDFYEYSVDHSGSSHLVNPLWLSVYFGSTIKKRVALYMWDGTRNEWSRLPCTMKTGRNVVQAAIHLTYAKIAIVGEDSFNSLVSQEAVRNGVTVYDPLNEFQVGIFPGTLDEDVDVELKYLNKEDQVDLPEGLEFVSDVYSFELRRRDNGILDKQVALALQYDDDSDSRKQLYYYDSNKQAWLPFTGMRYNDSEQRAYGMSVFSYAIIAVVKDTLSHTGTASWYADSRNPNGAATNFYPVGTEVRVTNLENNAFVDVKIVSTWSGVEGRVVDLVSTAFKQIASLGDGVISVRIEVLR